MKKAALVAGLLLLAVLWLGILAFGERDSFSIHMIVHMGVVSGAAPLIALGLSGSRHDLTIRWPWFTPVLASMVELVAVWGWHLPAARALAEASWLVTALEQASFLAAGVLLWLSCLGGALDGREAACRYLWIAVHLHAHDPARCAAGALAPAALWQCRCLLLRRAAERRC